MTCPSFTMSVCCAASLSILLPASTVTHKSVTLSVCTMASPSVISVCPSYNQSVHPPVNLSMAHQSATPPISPVLRPSDCLSLSDHLYTILPRPSGCRTSSDHTSTIYTGPSDCLSQPDHLYNIPPHLSDHLPPSHRLFDGPISPSACPSPAD